MFLSEAVSRGVKVCAGNPPVKIRGSPGFRGVRGTPLSYLFSFFTTTNILASDLVWGKHALGIYGLKYVFVGEF
jgi:hypothetical protein